MLFGLNLTHTRGDIYRALLEGIAYGTNHIFETYVEAGADPRRVYAVGGGTKNKVWAQATSDVSGRTQIIRDKTIGASYGDAFLAALAVGDVRRRTSATGTRSRPRSSRTRPMPASTRRQYRCSRTSTRAPTT